MNEKNPYCSIYRNALGDTEERFPKHFEVKTINELNYDCLVKETEVLTIYYSADVCLLTWVSSLLPNN